MIFSILSYGSIIEIIYTTKEKHEVVKQVMNGEMDKEIFENFLDELLEAAFDRDDDAE